MISSSSRLALLFILLSSYSSLINAAGSLKLHLHTWDYNPPSCCQPGRNFSVKCDCYPFLKLCIGYVAPRAHLHRDCSVAHVSRIDLDAPQTLELPFKGRWLSSNLKMIAEVVSDQTEKSLRLFHHNMNVFPRNTSVLRVDEVFEGSRLGIEFTVSCSENYFGNDCSRYCANDSKSTCDPEGNRVCREGWSGVTCQTPVCRDGCLHGVCAAPNTCRCEAGWTGSQCTTCLPHPNCVHGTCQQPFSCVCEQNWGGEWCDRDLDVCKRKSPCRNDGRCTTNGRQDYYFCNCTAGFEGKNCEIPVARITLDEAKCDCGPHESCVGQRCECVAGFEGRKCERKVGFKSPVDDICRSEDGSRRANGAKWTTIDCRQCACNQGEVQCSEAKCEHSDCVNNFNVCPFDQTCVGTDSVECLKGICPDRVGFCKPWGHASIEEAKARCAGQRETEECSRFFLEFDLKQLESGTTLYAVCHHLALTLFAEKLTNYAFDCARSDDRVVQVDMMSVQRDFHIGKVKRGLVNKLRHNATASPILRSVLRVVEFDGEELMAWERVRDSGNTKVPSTTNILITVVVVLLFVVVALLIVSLRRSKRTTLDAEPNDPTPESKAAFLKERSEKGSASRCRESLRKPPSRCPSPPPDYYSLPCAMRLDSTSSAETEEIV